MLMSIPFKVCYEQAPSILMEGAISERLKREYHRQMSEPLSLAKQIYDQNNKAQLISLYKQYIEIAEKYKLPLMITTPTRKANKENVSDSNLIYHSINQENARYLVDLKQHTKLPVYVGGLMGCKGDAYSGMEGLSIEEAYLFHKWQAQSLKEGQVDYLFAGIMPLLEEAIGVAKAMETTELPYIISFMINDKGGLLDGTSVHDAIVAIDANTNEQPLCYMTNCVHPTILQQTLSYAFNQTDIVKNRFKGIQANASALAPEQLDGAVQLESTNATELVEAIIPLRDVFDLKIFGGCCGTNHTHIEKIAKELMG